MNMQIDNKFKMIHNQQDNNPILRNKSNSRKTTIVIKTQTHVNSRIYLNNMNMKIP
jgi:hypothetical protein